jgi:hypothetical protein
MAALNITQGQLGITTTKYDHLCELDIPVPQMQRIVVSPPNSTTFPTKEMGYTPTTLSGKFNKLSGTEVTTLIAVIATGTAERKITFMLGGVECYGYAYSGNPGTRVCVNSTGLPTASDRQYELSFSFPLSRSKIYKASDDSTLWGG